MLITDLIRAKRDGGELDAGQIRTFVEGLTDESIPAEQVSALAMAIFLNGMTAAEAGLLTMEMARSGTVLDWRDAGLDGPVVDKHSTGGVGDKVSFMLAPIVAACGGYVPMISGRGLGHTGGTTDKIESIPGYESTPDFDRFRNVVRETGCAIIGQTADLAPADKRFYAIRDITGTVESVPLITASILSKKLAAGLDALVMDVKTGSGAFMSSLPRAQALAGSILATAGEAKLKTHALITDMNECLGTTAGNALEIGEAMRFLANEEREARLDEVTLALCAEMLVASGIETDRDAAGKKVDDAVTSGRAAEIFDRMVVALGGPVDFVSTWRSHLPEAPIVKPVVPEKEGWLAEVDAFAIGNAIIELGGGRRRLGDELDLSVGFSEIAPIGSEVGGERPLAVVHAASDDAAEQVARLLRSACRVDDAKPASRPVVYEVLPAE